MKRFHGMWSAVAVAMASTLSMACPSHDNFKPAQPGPAPAILHPSGLHDFDFFVGDWHAQHRKLKERLVGSHDWVVFDGTISVHALMNGWANEDESLFNVPGGAYRGVTLRAYDPATGLWSIWWLDGRMPSAPLDPPMRGRFVNGVGIFYADDTLRGKPVNVRFIWTHPTRDAAHWEQAFSGDGGKTWETNWITDFTRVAGRGS